MAPLLTSLPVPAVVGTAIKNNGDIRFRSCFRISLHESLLGTAKQIALAASITLPPPTAISAVMLLLWQ